MKEEFIKRIDDLGYKFDKMFLNPQVWEKVHGCIYAILLDYEDLIEISGYRFMSIHQKVQDDFYFCDYYILLQNKNTGKAESFVFADFVDLIFTPENNRIYTISQIIA